MIKEKLKKKIKAISEELQSGTLNHDEQREIKRKLTEEEAALEKIEEHLAKGT